MGSSPKSDLSAAFAEWMRSELGFQHVDLRVPSQRIGDRTRGVDIRGESYDRHWRVVSTAGAGAFFVGVVVENARFSPVPGLPPAALANMLLALSLIALGIGYAGRRRTRRYTWVDCRERKKAVAARAVQDLHDEARRGGAWRAAKVVMVSGDAGFDADAVARARSLGVECYQRVAAGFERVA